MITASYDTLLRQASMTSDEYLSEAISCINNRLGRGYAEKNPELIQTFMRVSAQEFAVASILKTAEEIVSSFASNER